MHRLPCACATARQVARVLTHLYDDRLRGAGIEAPQLALLMALDGEGPCTQNHLATSYAFDKTTISRNLRLLQKQGFIRSAVLKDKRKHNLTLTPSGRKILAAARPQWQKAQNDLRSFMTQSQWDALFQAFSTVLEAAAKITSPSPLKL